MTRLTFDGLQPIYWLFRNYVSLGLIEHSGFIGLSHLSFLKTDLCSFTDVHSIESISYTSNKINSSICCFCDFRQYFVTVIGIYVDRMFTAMLSFHQKQLQLSEGTIKMIAREIHLSRPANDHPYYNSLIVALVCCKYKQYAAISIIFRVEYSAVTL